MVDRRGNSAAHIAAMCLNYEIFPLLNKPQAAFIHNRDSFTPSKLLEHCQHDLLEQSINRYTKKLERKYKHLGELKVKLRDLRISSYVSEPQYQETLKQISERIKDLKIEIVNLENKLADLTDKINNSHRKNEQSPQFRI
jgi:hypothetical protein